MYLPHYASPLSTKITKANWRKEVVPAQMTEEEMIDLTIDMLDQEKFCKTVAEFLKGVLKHRYEEIGHAEITSDQTQVTIVSDSRSGGLDEARILEDMGEQFVEKYRKPASHFLTMRVKRL